VCLRVHERLCVNVSVYLCFFFVCLSVYLLVYLSSYLSICLSACLSICAMVHLWCVYIRSTYCSILSCLFVLIYIHIYVHTLTRIPSFSTHIYTCSDIHHDANTFHFPTRLRANTISHSLASTFARSFSPFLPLFLPILRFPSRALSLYFCVSLPFMFLLALSCRPTRRSIPLSLCRLCLYPHTVSLGTLSLPSHSLPRNSPSLPSHSLPRKCEGNVSE